MQKELLEKVTQSLLSIKNESINEVCPIGIIDINNWEWPQGVGMYGLYKCYKELGKKEYFDYLINWYDSHLAGELPDRNVNTTAPMLTLAYLAEETGRDDYMSLCKDWAEWIMNDMAKTEEGGIQHRVSGEENYNQLWSDTLFMTVLFLAKMGVMTDNESYIEEVKKQFLMHIKYLYNTKTGLWYHGWTFEGRHNFADAHWARGNCWFTICVAELADIMGLEGAFGRFISDTLTSQVEALAKYQHESGGWHTLINDPTSYLEASAAAGFGYGILKAARLGIIDKKYKEIGKKALEYVISNIGEDGVVDNVSYGTGMGKCLEDYKVIPICPMTYGQSLPMLILIEGIR